MTVKKWNVLVIRFLGHVVALCRSGLLIFIKTLISAELTWRPQLRQSRVGQLPAARHRKLAQLNKNNCDKIVPNLIRILLRGFIFSNWSIKPILKHETVLRQSNSKQRIFLLSRERQQFHVTAKIIRCLLFDCVSTVSCLRKCTKVW